MRTITGGELTTLLSAHPTHWLKVEVANASGTMKNLTNLGSVDWVDGCSISCEQLDTPVATATITLRRTGVLPKGLSPLLVASTLNVNDASAYAPLLDVGRTVRISCAVKALGATPSGGDWKELFLGRIDTVSWGDDPITISCSDLGAWLMDVQIETEDTYGSGAGVAVETVMQQLLTAWPGGVLAVPTLYTPASPGWLIHEYKQDRVKLFEAVRALALQIGWDVYYRYDASDNFRLTFFQPDRAKTTADATIGPTHYFEVTNLQLAIENIRNVCKVIYRKTDDTVDSVTSTDATSIAHFGRRYMEVQEAGTSNIDGSTEATLLASAAVSDLKSPIAEQEIKMLLYWPVQKGDLYTFTANGTHYDQDQKLAVISVKHDFASGTGTTTIQVRGTVAGAYADWLRVFEQNLVTPQVATLLPTWTADNKLSVSMTGNSITGSFKVAISTSAYPSLTLVRAATAANGRTAEVIFDGPFTAGDTVYVAALAYSGKDASGGESKVAEVTIDVLGANLVYSECKARVTGVTATTITVTVTATDPSGTPTVGLVGVTGTTSLNAGHAAGTYTYAQNGTDNVWTFNRGTAFTGPGQVQFRAVYGSSVTDDDFVTIPEVGRDTVYLVTRARVIATAATTVTVRVAVADPYPQGANSASIAHTYTIASGAGTVDKTSPQLCTPAATLTEAAGTYVDYVITRPATSTGSGRITFTVTDVPGFRVSDSDAVDVPAIDSTGLVYTECVARVTTVSATQVTVTVGANVASGTPTVGYVGLTGNTALSSGHTAGTYTYAINGSDNVWVFNRGTFGSGPGQAQFRAITTGAQNDDDFVEIPELARDTVFLSMRARVTDASATTVTVRVAVVDPFPQGAGSASIAHSYIIGGGSAGTVNKTSPQTCTPEATFAIPEAASTYVDYIVTRPAFGTGTGRITFTVTAGTRIADADAVDIPAQEQTSFGPSLEVVATPGTTSYSIVITYTGTMTYKINGGADNAGTGSPQTITATRPVYQGQADVYDFKCVKDSQTSTNSVTVPPVANIGGASFSIGTQTADDTTDYYAYSWSASGFPTGTTFDLLYKYTATGGTVVEGTVTNATSGGTVSAGADIGGSAKYVMTVNAMLNGSVISTKSKTGTFAV